MIDVCAIGISFLGTALTIVIAMQDRFALRILRGVGATPRLVRFFREAIFGMALLLIAALVASALGPAHFVEGRVRIDILSAFMMGTAAYCLCGVLRVVQILFALLQVDPS